MMSAESKCAFIILSLGVSKGLAFIDFERKLIRLTLF